MYIKFFETFLSQKELDELANDILKKISERTFDYHNDKYWVENIKVEEDKYWEKPDFEPWKMVDVKYRAYNLPGGWSEGSVYDIKYCTDQHFYFKGYNKLFRHGEIKLKWAKENIYVFKGFPFIYLRDIDNPEEKYDEILNMINVKDVKISLTFEKDPKYQGDFNDGNFPRLNLYYSQETLNSLRYSKKEKIESGRNYTYKEIYFNIFHKFHSTLLHELQHVYDSYRSGGKAFNKQMNDEEYKNDVRKKEELLNRGSETLKEEEIEFINRISKKYLNFPHEINARFTQAIRKTSFWDFDIDMEKEEEIYKMIDFHEVYKNFKRYFSGWSLLSKQDQYKLRRKLSQFWHLESEWLEKNKGKF